jgi:hypothetical protein
LAAGIIETDIENGNGFIAGEESNKGVVALDNLTVTADCFSVVKMAVYVGSTFPLG